MWNAFALPTFHISSRIYNHCYLLQAKYYNLFQALLSYDIINAQIENSNLSFSARSEQHQLSDESPQNYQGNIGEGSHLPRAALSGLGSRSHMQGCLSFSIDGDGVLTLRGGFLSCSESPIAFLGG